MSTEIRFVHSPYTFEGMVPVAIRRSLSNGQTPRIVRPAPVCAPRTSDSIMAATIRTLQSQNQKAQPRTYLPQQVTAPQPMMSFSSNPTITVRSPSMAPLAMPFALPSMKPSTLNVIPTASSDSHCCRHGCLSPALCQSPPLPPFPPRSPPSLHGSETSGEVLGTDSCPSDAEISSSPVATPTASQKETVRMVSSPQSPSSAAASSLDSEGDDDDADEKSGVTPADIERHIKMGREYHGGKALMLGCPCEHIAQWKRLRAKRGYSHFLCQLCGNKWKKSKFLSF